MKFVHTISINAPTRNVWKSLSSPDVWPSIFGKAGQYHQVSPEGGDVGSLYDMELHGGARATTIRCEIVGLRPGSMIAVRCVWPEMRHVSLGVTYHVTYELKDEGFGTTVTERFEMTGLGVPLDCVFWLFASLIYPFHWLAHNTCLQRLKGIVEGTRSP